MTQRNLRQEASSSAGVYAISVAAQLVEMEIQNLRVYERHGLVSPARSTGGSRLYSSEDVEKLRRVRELLKEGLNLAGVARVVELEREVERLRAELASRSAG